MTRNDHVPGRSRSRWIRDHVLEVIFNSIVTHLPGHAFRQMFLRLAGAQIGRRSSILRGTTVLEPGHLIIGDNCSIGFRCMLDARGSLTIGDNVVIASDTHIIAGYHDINDPGFAAIPEDVVIEDYVWIASRATILSGVTLGRGSVITACAMVHRDVDPLTVVGGVPAAKIGSRDAEALAYHPDYRPPFY